MTFAIVAGLMAASTAVSVYGQVQAGKAQEDELNRQAEEIKIAAEAQELERKQQLRKVLAANNANQSMSGTTGEGHFANIALESAKQMSASEGLFDLQKNLAIAQRKRQGANARSTANIGATSTLLSGASSAYGAYNTPTGP
jgi:hypothetical protein